MKCSRALPASISILIFYAILKCSKTNAQIMVVVLLLYFFLHVHKHMHAWRYIYDDVCWTSIEKYTLHSSAICSVQRSIDSVLFFNKFYIPLPLLYFPRSLTMNAETWIKSVLCQIWIRFKTIFFCICCETWTFNENKLEAIDQHSYTYAHIMTRVMIILTAPARMCMNNVR